MILEKDSSEHEEGTPAIDSSHTKAEIEAFEEQCRVIAQESLRDSSVFLLDEILLPLEELTVNPFTQDNPVYHSRKLIDPGSTKLQISLNMLCNIFQILKDYCRPPYLLMLCCSGC